jgi:hypothetical protein
MPWNASMVVGKYVVRKAGSWYWLRTVWNDILGYLRFLIPQHGYEDFS